jgi:hypothetical protein
VNLEAFSGEGELGGDAAQSACAFEKERQHAGGAKEP